MFGKPTDWKAAAAALHAPIRDEDWARVLPPLEALEKALGPLAETVPHHEELWTKPE
ncbi:MAG TPA: hypothetical protein VGN17_07575 [Bryobacteraceae bacterium]|jgi:hypothetical protein